MRESNPQGREARRLSGALPSPIGLLKTPPSGLHSVAVVAASRSLTRVADDASGGPRRAGRGYPGRPRDGVALTHIVDTSVLTRLPHPAIRAVSRALDGRRVGRKGWDIRPRGRVSLRGLNVSGTPSKRLSGPSGWSKPTPAICGGQGKCSGCSPGASNLRSSAPPVLTTASHSTRSSKTRSLVSPAGVIVAELVSDWTR